MRKAILALGVMLASVGAVSAALPSGPGGTFYFNIADSTNHLQNIYAVSFDSNWNCVNKFGTIVAANSNAVAAVISQPDLGASTTYHAYSTLTTWQNPASMKFDMAGSYQNATLLTIAKTSTDASNSITDSDPNSPIPSGNSTTYLGYDFYTINPNGTSSSIIGGWNCPTGQTSSNGLWTTDPYWVVTVDSNFTPNSSAVGVVELGNYGKGVWTYNSTTHLYDTGKGFSSNLGLRLSTVRPFYLNGAVYDFNPAGTTTQLYVTTPTGVDSNSLRTYTTVIKDRTGNGQKLTIAGTGTSYVDSNSHYAIDATSAIWSTHAVGDIVHTVEGDLTITAKITDSTRHGGNVNYIIETTTPTSGNLFSGKAVSADGNTDFCPPYAGGLYGVGVGDTDGNGTFDYYYGAQSSGWQGGTYWLCRGQDKNADGDWFDETETKTLGGDPFGFSSTGKDLQLLEVAGPDGSYPGGHWILIYDNGTSLKAVTLLANGDWDGVAAITFFTGSASQIAGTSGFLFVPLGQSTPEPATLMLLGTGVLGLAGIIRRRFIS